MTLMGNPPPQLFCHGEEVGVQLLVSRAKYTYLHNFMSFVAKVQIIFRTFAPELRKVIDFENI
jgi:hypothetical protein